LFFLIKDKIIDEFAIKETVEAIFLWWIFRLVKNKETKMGDYLKVKAVSKSIEEVIKIVKEQFPKFKTMGDLRRGVYDSMDKLLTNIDLYEYDWDFAELYKLDDKVNLNNLEALYQLFIGSKPSKEDYINWISRAHHANAYEELFKPASKNLDSAAVTGVIAKKLIVDVQEGGVKKLAQCRDAIQVLEKEFVEWFKPIHREVMPISAEELKKHCEEAKVDFKKYQMLENSNLIRNACLAPKCPHYLKFNESLGHHNAIWTDEYLPYGFHKTVRKFYKETPEFIYKQFEDGVLLKKSKLSDKGWHFEPEKYATSKDFVMSYIVKVQDVYKKIFG